ncbi:MAG: sensor histidine kinase, partial [Flavitalea sp.]
GIGMIGILLRLYYHRKFSRQLEKQKLVVEKQQAIEKERTRIAADMHDDLGAGLSRIKFLSETIDIKKQQELPIDEDISKIREYSSQMITKMGEIVWALNEKNDLLSELLSYTRSYAMEYLEQEGIICNVVLPEVLPNLFVSGEFRRNIFLSVKEILHNVVKHAGAEKVTIHINLDRHLQITICDNGIGINATNIRVGGYGLNNIEKRMEDLQGTMKVSSKGGTTIILTVKLPQ